MSEIPKNYEPQNVEDKWYQFWQEQKCFEADPSRVSEKRPGYSIVIPPPNVTGMLHMGHVLNNTIQDILARKARMDAKEVLWLSGTDHAGIATQVQVEKALKKEGKSKHDLGREKFLERVWEWKEKHGGIIINQLKKLGASCDWSRERFTLDEEYSKCVQRVFVDLYKKGLIYRGKRMVNWCPVSQTALSDEEVIMTPQKSFLWYFKVEVAEEPGTWLTIATTRPETIPGDTAVAVNPKDPRYGQLVGKHVVRPLPRENQAKIPIVADEHIDIEFGTGVLKVTPAHDKADFEIGQRHKLEVIDVLNPDGTMNDLAGEDLVGLDRFEAREKAAELLREMEVLEKEESYENNVGFSERAKVPIEPRLSEQWFLKYPSVEASTKCVADGTMKFHPERWAKVYDHWMTNIQDWCISRQLWWGHRVPVWTKCLTVPNTEKYNGAKWWFSELDSVLDQAQSDTVVRIIHRATGNEIDPHNLTLTDEMDSGQPNHEFDVFVCTTTEESVNRLITDEGFTQDPDVLDTWFSSWLWPFATMGWPEKSDDLKAFYPTHDLVTGPDIIFFWVARMIMAGYEYMEDLPFRNVYYTGIIRDKKGRKMSKTLGNSPDPLDLIAKYGADALRFGTMRSAPLGADVLFDEKDVELGRNFCTKLWNACRFRQMAGSGTGFQPVSENGDGENRQDACVTVFEVQGEIDPKLLTTDDKWILLRLDAAIRDITQAFADYKFTEATATLYKFFWSEFCAWYIEASKAAFFGTDEAIKANTLAVMDFVLSNTLRLFHPFMPFITEELWQGMGFNKDLPEGQGGKTIMFANWPKPLDDEFKSCYGLDETDERVADAKYDLVSQARSLRQEFNIATNKKIRFVLKPNGEISAHEIEVLRILLNAGPLDVDVNFQPTKTTPSVVSPFGELFLPLEGLIDFEAEKARLGKELGKIEKEIEKVENKLDNPTFRNKVPANVLEEHQARLSEWQAKFDKTKAAIEALEQ